MAKYGPIPKPVHERFWPKVNKNGPIPTTNPDLGPCWLWTANTNGKYGLLGSTKNRDRSDYAHRISWEMHYGPIPDGMCVCHHCDTPLCVRPDHLFLGTTQDNLADCGKKGRRRGRLSPPEAQRETWKKERAAEQKLRDDKRALPWAQSLCNNTLSPDNVRAIRARVDCGESPSAVSKDFGVTPATVTRIGNRTRWATLI